MTRTLLITPILVAVAGCAQASAYKEAAKQEASATADKLLSDSVWWTCKAASIGAVQRRFGQTGFSASVYRAFCLGGSGVQLLGPVEGQMTSEELPK